MTAGDFGIEAAKAKALAWLAGRVELTQVPWPEGAYMVFGPPDDYIVFSYVPPGMCYVGPAYYVAVHKRSGEVHPMGPVGE